MKQFNIRNVRKAYINTLNGLVSVKPSRIISKNGFKEIRVKVLEKKHGYKKDDYLILDSDQVFPVSFVKIDRNGYPEEFNKNFEWVDQSEEIKTSISGI